jgi:preprotein translocase subunit SecF
MGHVILLMSIILYIYAVTGFHLFNENDPENWGTLGSALLTLFQLVTLEGWVDVMDAVQDENPWAWVYFLTFILIGIYTWFRFQWKMGISAVIATLHDPLIILGFFAVTQIPFDLAVLAAILAVIGYSLNDTVVVFDRVRENFHKTRRASSEEVMDASINQTLSRTIITSGATLLVVVVLLIMGGETLRGFSWALTIGIIVGTYSSIYVAGALALDMKLSARDLMEQKETSKVDAMP